MDLYPPFYIICETNSVADKFINYLAGLAINLFKKI